MIAVFINIANNLIYCLFTHMKTYGNLAKLCRFCAGYNSWCWFFPLITYRPNCHVFIFLCFQCRFFTTRHQLFAFYEFMWKYFQRVILFWRLLSMECVMFILNHSVQTHISRSRASVTILKKLITWTSSVKNTVYCPWKIQSSHIVFDWSLTYPTS